MKILILADDFPPKAVGGPAIVAADLAVFYKNQGHEVVIVTSVRDEKEVSEYLYENIPVKTFFSDYHERWRSWRSLYNPRAVWFLNKIIRKFRPDAVHAHNIHYHISYHALRLAKRSGAKVVLTTHDVMLVHYGKFTDICDPTDISIPQNFKVHISRFRQIKNYKRWYNPFRNLIIKYYLRFCDHVCAVSYAQKELLEFNGIKNLKVIHNGIDIDKWRFDPADIMDMRTELGLSDDPVILFSGRISNPKGIIQLIDAAEIARRTIKNLKILVVGRAGKDSINMENYARKKGLSDLVKFSGWLQGKRKVAAYALADIVTFPSVCFDTFGLVNLEGMAVKKPIIASCFGGAREIVENDVMGFIINPFDHDRFAELILKLLKDKNTSRIMGEKGYERVQKMFLLQKQGHAYLRLFH